MFPGLRDACSKGMWPRTRTVLPDEKLNMEKELNYSIGMRKYTDDELELGDFHTFFPLVYDCYRHVFT